MTNYVKLPLLNSTGHFHAVIETPRGSRVKIAYRPELKIFEFSRPLVLGVVYPFDWGFFPSTLAEDGDPLDALVMHGAATYPGVVIVVRPVGAVRVSQRNSKGIRQRNDRVITVPVNDPRFDDSRRVTRRVQHELERFFLSAVLMENKKVTIDGWDGDSAARKLIEDAARKFEKNKGAK